MSAEVISLAEWLLAHRGRQLRLPNSTDIAIAHIRWLRSEHPRIRPQEVGAMLGVRARSWAAVIEVYARMWEELPENIRRDYDEK